MRLFVYKCLGSWLFVVLEVATIHGRSLRRCGWVLIDGHFGALSVGTVVVALHVMHLCQVWSVCLSDVALDLLQVVKVGNVLLLFAHWFSLSFLYSSCHGLLGLNLLDASTSKIFLVVSLRSWRRVRIVALGIADLFEKRLLEIQIRVRAHLADSHVFSLVFYNYLFE